ncbi:hypothetical protein PR003_g19875 [Phytophthora rubi]|uniref:CCHC-type domain-containing protein n=1 Tax=Phytophthora rubi TaxID=129364 RepID=A0A6A4DP58_9STRA|nr:hypothetical protein PR003_g19875 [Phytophthora rubi]
MTSHGSGGDYDSYSDGPESGCRDAFASKVFLGDANPGEGGRPTPITATTTPGAPTEGTARWERDADAPPGNASQPDLTTPEGRGAVRDVLGRAMASTSYTGGGQRQGPHGLSDDAQTSGAGRPRLISKACPYPSHKVVKVLDFKHKVWALVQSTQYANPFATGAPSTPASTTQYNKPYGGTAYGVTAPAAPSVKMPQTAITSYGGISVANMQRAGFGFANPFSQPAGQAPTVLPAPQQPQQPAWAGQTQPSPQPQAGQGQVGANANSPSSVKVEPPQLSRSSLAGQQSYVGVPGYGYNGNPYADSNQRQPVYGMPSSIKNAVRMIQPFYSDGAAVEKARAFWDSFEMATVGLNDSIRLSAFRECLKGKTGEDWWMYSQISDFETLRRRFHNQFICQTSLQMIERLTSMKRTKGMSAEVWGDLMSSLCNAAHCYDEQMRYQYFLSGLRNREWKTALTTSMVNTIPEAVFVLLYKKMHLPVEDDAEFEDDGGKKPATESAMMQQMLNMMQQTQNLLAQQHQTAQAHRSPKRAPMVAAAYENAMGSPRASDTASGPESSGAYPGGIRQGPDRFTQDGLKVCGRCHLMGCSRITCRYGNMTCRNCRMRGHVTSECDRPRQQGAGGMNRGQPQGSSGTNRGQQQNAGGGNGYSPRNPRACYMCKATDHGVSDCPLMSMLRNMAGQNASGTTRVQGQVPSPQ